MVVVGDAAAFVVNQGAHHITCRCTRAAAAGLACFLVAVLAPLAQSLYVLGSALNAEKQDIVDFIKKTNLVLEAVQEAEQKHSDRFEALVAWLAPQLKADNEAQEQMALKPVAQAQVSEKTEEEIKVMKEAQKKLQQEAQEATSQECKRAATKTEFHRAVHLAWLRAQLKELKDEAPERDCQCWAAQGGCETAPGYMKSVCTRSCAQAAACEALAQASVKMEQEIKDEAPEGDCQCWAAQGGCETNSGYMKSHCARSCAKAAACEALIQEIKGAMDAPPEFPVPSKLLLSGPPMTVPQGAAKMIATHDQLPRRLLGAPAYTFIISLKVNNWDVDPGMSLAHTILYKGYPGSRRGHLCPSFYVSQEYHDGPFFEVRFGTTLGGEGQPPIFDPGCSTRHRTLLPIGPDAPSVRMAVLVKANGLQIIYVDGVEKARCHLFGLQLNDAPLYIGNPDPVAVRTNVTVADIRYENRFLAPAEVREDAIHYGFMPF